MKISAKARYGLSTMICLSQNYASKDCISVISLAERLGISKIYLEQVFSLLKRARLVVSAKGAQGGYRLARIPKEISALDVLSAIEVSLFEKTGQTVSDNEQAIEEAMQRTVFDKLDDCVASVLSDVSLEDLTAETDRLSSDDGYMYYL